MRGSGENLIIVQPLAGTRNEYGFATRGCRFIFGKQRETLSHPKPALRQDT
jgi:hypothetical protein